MENTFFVINIKTYKPTIWFCIRNSLMIYQIQLSSFEGLEVIKVVLYVLGTPWNNHTLYSISLEVFLSLL